MDRTACLRSRLSASAKVDERRTFSHTCAHLSSGAARTAEARVTVLSGSSSRRTRRSSQERRESRKASKASSAPRPATLSRTLHGAVLILPLLYMQLAQGRTLGSSAMETRVVGMVDMSALSAALEGETQTDDEVEPTTTPVVDIMNLDGAGEAWFDEEAGEDGKAIIDDTTPTVGPTSRSVALEGEVTLLDILDNTNKMIDERLVTRGMVYRVDGVPDGYFLLFRFKITCCVADAEPLWILVGHKDADQFASDQWLRVEGTLRTREVEGEPMALIEATSITEIEEPKDVYLY